MSADGWTRHYYDAVEFYYWGPDKLESRRVTQPKLVGAQAVLSRLRRLEEPLNHILTLFFDLAPEDAVRRFIRFCANLDVESSFRLSDRTVQSQFSGLNVVQPDLLFLGDDAIVSVEVKIGAKSSFSQVVKYALLHGVVRSRPEQLSVLIYLTQKPFHRCWPSPLDANGVLAAAKAEFVDTLALGQLVIDAQKRISIDAELEAMRLCGVSFYDIASWLTEERKSADPTFRKLCDGLLAELASRSVRS